MTLRKIISVERERHTDVLTLECGHTLIKLHKSQWGARARCDTCVSLAKMALNAHWPKLPNAAPRRFRAVDLASGPDMTAPHIVPGDDLARLYPHQVDALKAAITNPRVIIEPKGAAAPVSLGIRSLPSFMRMLQMQGRGQRFNNGDPHDEWDRVAFVLHDLAHSKHHVDRATLTWFEKVTRNGAFGKLSINYERPNYGDPCDEWVDPIRWFVIHP